MAVLVACGVLGMSVIGIVQLTSGDGPPSCAQRYANAYDVAGGEEMNKVVDCMTAVDKWCTDNHPEDPDGCSNDVYIDGDDRNVGKE
ncbi:hypothetical protein [Streptomyces sp. NPDC002599]|uniref:hypothetical protein n=1 Tax=Streptomyces sp. NPDC002599 TaxID=3154421 RepID=UPI0033197668